MDTFEPLVELRGEWRSAAAISIPAAAAQVAAALDRALDVLVDAEQVDEESLTMAAEMVCKAVVARSDEVELLRRRLHRAIRDYVTVTAIDAAPMEADSSAFESEEALAAALFASVGESIGIEDAFQAEMAAAPEAERPGRRIDEKALRKSLARQPGKTKARIVSFIKLLIPIAIVAGVTYYVLNHLPAQAVVAPPVACTPTPDAGVVQNGCFKGAAANCPGGRPDGASCTYSVAVSGQVPITLTWNTHDTLAVVLSQSKVQVAGAAAQASTGVVTLKTPTLTQGKYDLIVTNVSANPSPTTVIQFSVSAG